jgi:two-component system sensor histidine kinase LytS
VVVPLRVSSDEVRHIGLGRRHGGRRFLSEDLDGLAQLASCAEARIELLREAELRRLVSQAEMRALQAQIHPHFLFNALNTLYGVIPRQAAGARRMVLNLADIFRYFLAQDRTLIALAEEMRIVEAYLEVESLRLGHRLRTEFAIDPAARTVRIPALSVQPLVENAVKHGVSAQVGGGFVRVEAAMREGAVQVVVTDSGPGFDRGRGSKPPGAGVGLDNVRQRLRLCFGDAAELHITSRDGLTRVAFQVPVPQLEAVSPAS